MNSKSGKTKRGRGNRKASDLAATFVQKLKPDDSPKASQIALAWGKVVGEKIGPLTEVEDFLGGSLTVLVKSSTLYALLVQYEKSRLLELLRRDFPQVKTSYLRWGKNGNG